MIDLDWIKSVFRTNDKDNSILFSQTIVNSKLHILSCYTNFKFDATVFISKNFPLKKLKTIL